MATRPNPTQTPRPTTPAPTGHLTLGDALGRSEPLTRLLQRVHESRERFAAVSVLLPPGLLETVRPGPLDDDGWSLLAAHGASAAKLRQLIPRLEAALVAKGWQPTPIKVRVQPPPA
jgi:hypothetical protein